MNHLQVFTLLVLVISIGHKEPVVRCHLQLLEPPTGAENFGFKSFHQDNNNNNNNQDQQKQDLKDIIEFEELSLLLSDSKKEWPAPTGAEYSGSCQLVQVAHVLRHAGCQPKAIASFACSGRCSSYVQTSTSKFWQHERSCSCCQQAGSQEATFTLDCPSLDPPYKKVKTHAPVECMCRSCTDSTKEHLRPHELVEALAAGESNANNGPHR